MEIKNDNTYYIIYYWMCKRLNLKGIDLVVYAIIYGFSHDGNSKYCGSTSYIMELSGASKKTILESLKRLVQDGLIVKYENYVNGVKFCNYSANMDCVENYTGGVKITPRGGVKITPNNIDIDNIDKEKEKNKKEKEIVDDVQRSSTTSDTSIVRNVDYYIADIRNNQQQKESMCMSARVTMEELDYLIERFYLYAKSTMETYANASYIYKHIVNWIRMNKDTELEYMSKDVVVNELIDMFGDSEIATLYAEYKKKQDIGDDVAKRHFIFAKNDGMTIGKVRQLVKGGLRLCR